MILTTKNANSRNDVKTVRFQKLDQVPSIIKTTKHYDAKKTKNDPETKHTHNT